MKRPAIFSYFSAVAISLMAGSYAFADTLPSVTMYKDPYCACCDAWADHMKSAGFDVDVKIENNMSQIKNSAGIAPQLASCHTALVNGYVVEGHVPASAVKKMLETRPEITGLAVPGMPIGSPGMEVQGQEDDIYHVIAFDNQKAGSYGRYKGSKEH